LTFFKDLKKFKDRNRYWLTALALTALSQSQMDSYMKYNSRAILNIVCFERHFSVKDSLFLLSMKSLPVIVLYT